MPQLIKPTPAPSKQGRPDRLALSLACLGELEPSLRAAALGGRLDLSSPIKVDPARPTEVVIEVLGDLLEKATAIDIVQHEQRKAGLPEVEVYLSRFGVAWTRLPKKSNLTAVMNGRVILNPAIFGAREVSQDEVKPLEVSPVIFNKGV